MIDITETVEVTTEPKFIDQVATTVLGAIAGMVVNKLVTNGYMNVVTRYRQNKNTAHFEQ